MIIFKRWQPKLAERQELGLNRFMDSKPSYYVGTAAWCIPKQARDYFLSEGSVLEKYSTRFNSVEINSSFYRHHKAVTYERWASVVPDNFSFSVKLSKTLTHEKRLDCSAQEIAEVIRPIRFLGPKFGCLLVQLPPSLGFEAETAKKFFLNLRGALSIDAPIAFEPRHAAWDNFEAQTFFKELNISLVRADPEAFERHSKNDEETETILYLRLHGSPILYESSYEQERLKKYAEEIRVALAKGKPAWCIFDNTKFGHATLDALNLIHLLQ